MKTVVCIASGPSLTAADCETVRKSRQYTIVVNSSYALAPFANVLYAGDSSWWEQYGQEARQRITECWTSSDHAAQKYGLHKFEARDFINSGYQAIELAVLEKKATKVLLLGYDMQHTNGRRHWHIDHPSPLENAELVQHWPERFSVLKSRFSSVEIINCTRDSALTCFRKIPLEEVLICKQDD